MKYFYRIFITLCIIFSPSILAKQIVVKVENRTVSNCFVIESITSNGYLWNVDTRIPRGGEGKISLVHNSFSKQPHSEITFMCAAKTVTVVAEDTTSSDQILSLNLYQLRNDDGVKAVPSPLDDRSKKNKPILGLITLIN